MFELIQNIDVAVLSALQGISNPALDIVMVCITFLGSPVFWFAVAAFLYWKGHERDSFFMMNIILFTASLVQLAKSSIERPRPSTIQYRVLDSFAETRVFSDFSFPSGHSTMISAASVYLSKFFKMRHKILIIIPIILVAFSRLYLGKHYLSDVIAGIVIGALIGYAMFKLWEYSRCHDFRKLDTLPELGLLLAIGLLIVLFSFMESMQLVAIFAGYYLGLGFFLKSHHDQPKLEGIPNLKKQAVGFFVLLILLLPYLFQTAPETQFISMFLAGLWVSLIWPLAYAWIKK